MISFLVLFNSASSKAKFNSLEPPVKIFLEWVVTKAFLAAEEIMVILKVRFLWRKSALRAFQFLKSENRALHELEAEQSSQLLRTSLVVQMYSMEDDRVGLLFFHVCRERNFSVTLLNCARFLQLVLDYCGRKLGCPMK